MNLSKITLVVASALLAVAAPVAVAIMTPKKALAAPFTCNPNTLYQSKTNTLYKLNPATGEYEQVGNPAAFNYNALAMNPNDGYMYAIRSNHAELLRISSDGSAENLGDIEDISHEGITEDIIYPNGDFDADGTYWIKERDTTSVIYGIDVETKAVTEVTLSQDVPQLADISTQNGYAYGVTYNADETRNELYRINLTNGNVTASPIENMMTSAAGVRTAGATWITVDGHFYISSNSTGAIFEITDYETSTPAGKKMLEGLPANSNDGAVCKVLNEEDPAPAPIFYVDAEDDDFRANPVTTNGGVAGNILANDTRNGHTPALPDYIDITVDDDGGIDGVSVDRDGNVNIPSGTPTGTYTLHYTICDTVTEECDDAAIVLTVVEAPKAPDTPTPPKNNDDNESPTVPKVPNTAVAL